MAIYKIDQTHSFLMARQTEKFSRDEALDFWRRIFTPQP
jgi:hypothetical protein